MQLWGLAILTGGVLFPFALLAQHTAAPIPSHVSPAVSHVSSGPSARIHPSSGPSSRTLGGTPASRAQGSHTNAQTARNQKATGVKETGVSQSVRNSSSERRGLFSLLRKRGPGQGGSQSRCKHGRCSNNGTATDRVAATAEIVPAPEPSKTRLGCTVVAVNNPAVPCNPMAPCCP
jgi:hypothetical protein